MDAYVGKSGRSKKFSWISWVREGCGLKGCVKPHHLQTLIPGGAEVIGISAGSRGEQGKWTCAVTFLQIVGISESARRVLGVHSKPHNGLIEPEYECSLPAAWAAWVTVQSKRPAVY